MEKLEQIIIKKIDDMQNEIIEFLQDIIKIPSEVPPGRYKEISKFIASKMEEYGIKTQRKRHNVIGEIGNENNQVLIFNAHFDTVASYDGWKKNPYSGEINDDKIYGRGSSDDKACVAAEIFAAKALINAGFDFNGKLIISAVINEEIGGMFGSEYLVNEEILKGDACLLGDSVSDFPVTFRGGTFQISFIIKGLRRNAQAFPDLPSPNRNKYSGINSINKMLPIMNFLMKLQDELEIKETEYPMHPDMPSKISSVNFTSIKGGVSVNSIPDKCVLNCLITTIPEQDVEELKKKILDFIDDYKKKDDNLDIIVQIPISINPQITDINSNFAKIVKEAYKIVYNEERDFKVFIPTTDAHFFQQKGIETILIGSLRGENNHHSTDEFVYIEDLINVTKLYAITALNYLK